MAKKKPAKTKPSNKQPAKAKPPKAAAKKPTPPKKGPWDAYRNTAIGVLKKIAFEPKAPKSYQSQAKAAIDVLTRGNLPVTAAPKKKAKSEDEEE